MYIGEFLLWFGNSLKSATRKKMKMGYLNEDMLLSEVEKDYTQEQVSDTPRAIGPYYAYNARYLEIRSGMFENFRGIVTWISLFLFLVLSFFINPMMSTLFSFSYGLDEVISFGNVYTKKMQAVLTGIVFFGCIGLYITLKDNNKTTVKMAEQIFKALNWQNISKIDLRRFTNKKVRKLRRQGQIDKNKKQPTTKYLSMFDENNFFFY